MGVGDIVWTPPDVRHWHGGSHDRSMLHLAISFGGVNWQEPVSAEQYESARMAG
jgi:quercetin dioxygenase-like cupin family protein